MTCMHPYLIRNIGPPLWCSIVIGCLCLLSKSLLCSFHVLAHSYASHPLSCKSRAYPGSPRWLLLSLFIKHECAPKCGVAWFITNELNRSFIFWIILRIVLSFIVRIVPTPIKIVNQSWTCLKLKQYSSSICYHQPSWNCQVIQICIS